MGLDTFFPCFWCWLCKFDLWNSRWWVTIGSSQKLWYVPRLRTACHEFWWILWPFVTHIFINRLYIKSWSSKDLWSKIFSKTYVFCWKIWTQAARSWWWPRALKTTLVEKNRLPFPMGCNVLFGLKHVKVKICENWISRVQLVMPYSMRSVWLLSRITFPPSNWQF